VYRLQKENENLRKLLAFKEQFTQEVVGCNIIAKDSGNLFETFTIDRGSKDGISVNDPVINSNGLVGRDSFKIIEAGIAVRIIAEGMWFVRYRIIWFIE